MDNELHAIENHCETSATCVASPPLSELLSCPSCVRSWPNDSEQAACIRLFSECIVCRVEREVAGEIDSIGIAEIQEERYRWRNGGCNSGECVGHGHICE